MGGEVQDSARRLKAALIARLSDNKNEQQRPGLLRALQLSEKFINSNAASVAALDVLKEEVAKVLTKACGHQPKKTHFMPARTRKTYASSSGQPRAAVSCPPSSSSSSTATACRDDQPPRTVTVARIKQVPAMLALDVTSPDLPTARLEHKAHLTLNEFDAMTLQQARKAQEADAQRALERRKQQQQLAAMCAAQVAEVQAQREAQRLAKLREIEETDAAVAAAYQAELLAKQQHRNAQHRQHTLYREQQLEAESARRAAAAVAAREAQQERAELAAAEAAAAEAAAARAAAARAKLEAFKAEAAAAVEAKRVAAAEARERERLYVEECKRAMDAAEAKRVADQEAWRTKQRMKYAAAGGVSMERRLEEQAVADAERAAREQAAHEARVAAAEAAQRSAQQEALRSTLQGLDAQLAEKEAARRAAAAAKLAEREAAAAEQQALTAAKAADKERQRQQKQEALQQARQELAAWRQRKFVELNAPMADADRWVHGRVLRGSEQAFL